MSKLNWYWHRLRAMSPVEMALHARKKLRQLVDARRLPDWTAVCLEASDAFPQLPPADKAPAEVCDALRRDTEEILAGRWKAFGHLEAGMRLIQVAWIDALLSEPGAGPERQQRLAALRQTILPTHVWFTWRHKSFGSSANNHLLGELAGCLIATARWPALARWGV